MLSRDALLALLAGHAARKTPLTWMIQQLGAVQSVKFTGVGPGGRDIYEVKFENGMAEFRIGMTADRKIEGVGFRNLK